MNFPPRSPESNKTQISNKSVTLNPNAAEFVPSSHRSTYGITNTADSSKVETVGTSGITIFSHSKSSISDNSDEDALQDWRHQLPDDITPDYKAMGKDEQLSLAGLSIHGGMETSRLSSSRATRQGKSSLSTINVNLTRNLGYSSSTYSQDESSAPTFTSSTNSWSKQFISGDQQLLTSNGDSGGGFVNNVLVNQATLEDAAISQLKLLASRFPIFSTESIANIYCANGCDLDYTAKLLGQLQLQGDGGLSPNLNLKSFGVTNLSNGLSKHTSDFHQVPDTYRSTSSGYGGAADFVTTLRKVPPQDGVHWKSSSANSIGSSGRAQLLASLHNGQGKSLYEDNSLSLVASRTAPPVWPDNNEAVDAYSGSREEALELVSLRNICLEKANQLDLMGNTTLAKELREKGNLYNMQLKAAQLKAGDAIYRTRDSPSHELQNYSRGGQDRLIDLHGLHISDALHVLKHELNVLKSTARSSRQHLLATIFLGSSQLSKGIWTSPRLPMVVEQCLSDEGLHFTQPQPGLLHVVIY